MTFVYIAPLPEVYRGENADVTVPEESIYAFLDSTVQHGVIGNTPGIQRTGSVVN